MEEAGGWHREPLRTAREVAAVAFVGIWAEPPMLLAHSWLGAEYFLPRLADWITYRHGIGCEERKDWFSITSAVNDWNKNS